MRSFSRLAMSLSLHRTSEMDLHWFSPGFLACVRKLMLFGVEYDLLTSGRYS